MDTAIEMIVFYLVISYTKHNEHNSVNEIILWYKYLLNKNYKNISFVGHSRGGLNILQASLLLDSKQSLYLLAPIIDTYDGTSQYYSKKYINYLMTR